VASILPFLRKTGTAFDDHATKAMGEAFDTACKALHDKGQPQIAYEIVIRGCSLGASKAIDGSSLDDMIR
jgi:hypothetical protein